MTEFSISGFVFWLAFLSGASYFYLKIRKKEITFFKVLGLGLLCYVAFLVLALGLFLIGDLI